MGAKSFGNGATYCPKGTPGARGAWIVRPNPMSRRRESDFNVNHEISLSQSGVLRTDLSGGKLAAVLSYKFVAGAGNGDDQFRPLRILFQLLSKAGNMSIHRSRERIRHIAPNCL